MTISGLTTLDKFHIQTVCKVMKIALYAFKRQNQWNPDKDSILLPVDIVYKCHKYYLWRYTVANITDGGN